MCLTDVHWWMVNCNVANQTMDIFFLFTNTFRSLLLSSSGCVTIKERLLYKQVYKMYHKTTWCYTSFFCNAPYGHKISNYITVQCSTVGCFGDTRWRSWLRHGANSRKVAGVTGIFQWPNPSGRTMAVGSTQPLTEISIRNISWGVKAAGAWGWQPYHLNCADCLETEEPQPVLSRPVQRLALPLHLRRVFLCCLLSVGSWFTACNKEQHSCRKYPIDVIYVKFVYLVKRFWRQVHNWIT